MQGYKLDMVASKEERLRVLVSYLEELSKGGSEGLPITNGTLVLISRYLRGWNGLFSSKGGEGPRLTPEGALRYYLKLMEEK